MQGEWPQFFNICYDIINPNKNPNSLLTGTFAILNSPS